MPIFGATPLQPIKNGWHVFSDLVCNKLTEGAESFLKKHTGADLFIVTGPAGVGKSSFIKSITGEDVYIGSTLESGTKTTSLVPSVIGNQRCLFLDMPGFNTRDFDDWDVFHRLMTAMSVVERYVEFRGVLYVDSMEENRVTPATEKILTWLWLFCGQDYMPNVTIVTTRWDGLDVDGIQSKMSRVERWQAEGLLQRFFSHGASIYHHGLVMEGGNYKTLHIERRAEERRLLARDEITARYHDPTTLKLQIYTEIANGATIDTTLAGKLLKYGRAADDTQGHGEASTDSSTGSDSAREEQRGEHQQRDRANSYGEASARAAWADQFSYAWEDIKPWVRLLYMAARMYMSSSSSSSPSSPPVFDSFVDDDSQGIFFEEEFSFPDEPFSGPEESSGWGCVIL
ncbi:uncharacterized protein CDV56_106958 [Aspergillus thermomutatus]|uniref:G domain-containing protein n=1 Tax=Aspergillus thermomutatus TaxID=41047 RepID=A0A397I1M6_ASPTH|nr:uncharacterized protein CDV56_106958 [Aspergillus thermomutatus]RHZ67324.1 hypothetical protein CDV56_106958 [Aspergillus thermomutatus]